MDNKEEAVHAIADCLDRIETLALAARRVGSANGIDFTFRLGDGELTEVFNSPSPWADYDETWESSYS